MRKVEDASVISPIPTLKDPAPPHSNDVKYVLAWFAKLISPPVMVKLPPVDVIVDSTAAVDESWNVTNPLAVEPLNEIPPPLPAVMNYRTPEPFVDNT